MAGGAIDHSEHSEPTTVSDELDALLTTNGDESSLTNGTAAAAHDISNNNFVQTKCPYCQGHKVLKRYYYNTLQSTKSVTHSENDLSSESPKCI